MDFESLLYAAKKNEHSVKKEAQNVKCYQTKFAPPKKEQKKCLSANIQKFLARKEEEEKRKQVDAQKKREELLELRSHDTKAKKRVQAMLKRTKAANKSVIEDAVDDNNTAVTLGGPSQPDEDDYGYVSQEASAFYNKLMDKYSTLPPEEPKFKVAMKHSVKDLNSTKDRVRMALLREEEEELMPHKRKRKTKEEKAGEEVNESEEVPEEESKDDEEEERKPEKRSKPRRPAPPPIDFYSLLKLAEKKQFEPVKIEPKVKEPEEEERPMTKKQRLEYEREREWRMKKERAAAEKADHAQRMADTDENPRQKSALPDKGQLDDAPRAASLVQRIPKIPFRDKGQHREDLKEQRSSIEHRNNGKTLPHDKQFHKSDSTNRTNMKSVDKPRGSREPVSEENRNVKREERSEKVYRMSAHREVGTVYDGNRSVKRDERITKTNRDEDDYRNVGGNSRMEPREAEASSRNSKREERRAEEAERRTELKERRMEMKDKRLEVQERRVSGQESREVQVRRVGSRDMMESQEKRFGTQERKGEVWRSEEKSAKSKFVEEGSRKKSAEDSGRVRDGDRGSSMRREESGKWERTGGEVGKDDGREVKVARKELTKESSALSDSDKKVSSAGGGNQASGYSRKIQDAILAKYKERLEHSAANKQSSSSIKSGDEPARAAARQDRSPARGPSLDKADRSRSPVPKPQDRHQPRPPSSTAGSVKLSSAQQRPTANGPSSSKSETPISRDSTLHKAASQPSSKLPSARDQDKNMKSRLPGQNARELKEVKDRQTRMDVPPRLNPQPDCKSKQLPSSDARSRQPPPSDTRSRQSLPSDSKSRQFLPSDMRSRQPPPSDVRSRQPPPSDARSRQPPPSDARSRQPPPSDARSRQPPPSDARSRQPPPSDARSRQPPPSDARSRQPPPSDARSRQPPPSDARSRQPPPSDARSRQPPPSDARSRQPPPSDARSRQPPPSDARSRQPPPSDARSRQPPPSDARSRQSLPSEARSRQPPPSDARSRQFPPSEVKSRQFPPSDVKSRQFPPSDVKSRQFPPSDVKSRQFPPSDVKGRQFPPADVRRKPLRPPAKRRIIDSDEEEYDSDLDDFIVDGPEEEEDYSSLIKQITGYDRSKYRDMDDDECMESSFSQQLKEEFISTKTGILEDLEDMQKEADEKKRKMIMKKKKLK